LPRLLPWFGARSPTCARHTESSPGDCETGFRHSESAAGLRGRTVRLQSPRSAHGSGRAERRHLHSRIRAGADSGPDDLLGCRPEPSYFAAIEHTLPRRRRRRTPHAQAGIGDDPPVLQQPVVPENSIPADSRGEAESAHHPMRCLRSSTCLQPSQPICSSHHAGLKSRTFFCVISSTSLPEASPTTCPASDR
jgi:hypothetical protein